MAQCNEWIMVTPKADRLYRNGVEMQVARTAERCTDEVTTVVSVMGKSLGYCDTHGAKRRAWAADVYLSA